MYELLNSNDKRLKQKADIFDFGSLDAEKIARKMLDIMYLNDGMGLAGPQIGLMRRIFVVGEFSREYVFINPQIISTSGNISMNEGCLSFPNLRLQISRPSEVTIQAQNTSGKVGTTTFKGILARAILHEFDHLDGVCFTDKVSKLKLKMAQSKL